VTVNEQLAVLVPPIDATQFTLVSPTGNNEPDDGVQVAWDVSAPLLTLGESKLTTTGLPSVEVTTGPVGQLIDSPFSGAVTELQAPAKSAPASAQARQRYECTGMSSVT
jgi:hypothetical protein